MDLYAALARDSEVRDLKRLVGLDNAWMFTGPNDRFRKASVLAPDGEHAFELCAMDSWNEDLARAVLAFAVEHADAFLSSDKLLTPVSGFKSPVGTFDTVTAVHGDILKYRHDEVPELTQASTAVFAGWYFEFAEGATRDEVTVQIKDANGLNTTTWGREPLPFHRVRFINSKMQNRTLGNKRKLNTRHTLELYLAELDNTDDTSFVEFENRLGDTWHIAWRDGTWYVTDVNDPSTPAQTFDRDGILAFAEASLRRG